MYLPLRTRKTAPATRCPNSGLLCQARSPFPYGSRRRTSRSSFAAHALTTALALQRAVVQSGLAVAPQRGTRLYRIPALSSDIARAPAQLTYRSDDSVGDDTVPERVRMHA